jgi:arsenate reductase
MAEAILNHVAEGAFRAHSAGSHPNGEVHPLALEQLRQAKLPAAGLRSKSWDEFAAPGAPAWPGQPLTAHWGIPDPAAVAGTLAVRQEAFRRAYLQLETRINLLVTLRVESLDRFCLQRHLQAIGRTIG